MDYLLSIIIFFPALSSVLLVVLKSQNARIFAIIVAFLELVWTLLLFKESVPLYGGIMFFTQIPIIEHYGISYCIGVDNLSIFLLILNAFITLLSISFIKNLSSSILVAIFCLESIVMGVFSSLDMILFYIFWEISLLPVLYIIGIWGSGNKSYAALKYFIYTFSASLIMLLGILYYAYEFYLIEGIWSFNVLDWYRIYLDLEVQKWIFIAFFIGVATKIPLFPLHSWQPYAYTQAPIIGSALIAGVLSKMGTYALLRFILPFFPTMSADSALFVSIICVFMIIYGAMLALAQNNVKTLIAYSSISHMGIIVLGIFALNVEGMGGASFLMLSHGLVVASLFLLVGVAYERIGSVNLNSYGGLAKYMPKFSTNFGIITMCSLGLPLTMGFVGEVLCLYGYFQVSPLIAFLAGSSFFVGAIYMLVAFRKIFYGNGENLATKPNDISLARQAVFLPMIAVVVIFGIYPKPILEPLNATMKTISQMAESKKSIEAEALKSAQDSGILEGQLPIMQDENEIIIIPQVGE